MSKLEYRTEDHRLDGNDSPINSGDQFHPQTEAQRVAEDAKDQPKKRDDYPQWVSPHPSRIVVSDAGVLSVHGFQYHVSRDRSVTVLVQNEDEKEVACSETQASLLAREAAQASDQDRKSSESAPT